MNCVPSVAVHTEERNLPASVVIPVGFSIYRLSLRLVALPVLLKTKADQYCSCGHVHRTTNILSGESAIP